MRGVSVFFVVFTLAVFHNRLDLIREPAFYWVFYFSFPINLVYFIIRSNDSGLFVLVH